MKIKQIKNQFKKITIKQILVFPLLTVGLVVALYLVKKTTDIRNRADLIIPVDLSIAYTGGPVAPMSTVEIPITINSNSYRIVAGEIHFSYDPLEKITLTNIVVTPQSLNGKLPVVLKSFSETYDNQNHLNDVQITLGVNCNDRFYCQTMTSNEMGEILKLKFVTDANFTQAIISINSLRSKFIAIDGNNYTQDKSVVSSVKIATTSPTSTPDPGPVAPTSTPTPTPTLMPTPIPVVPTSIPTSTSNFIPTPTFGVPNLKPPHENTCNFPSSCKSPSSCSGYIGAQLNCDYGLKCCTPSLER